MNCAKCNRDVSNAKDVAKCVECDGRYHVSCCRIRTLAKLTAMTPRSLTSWKCDDCAQDTSSLVSNKSDPEDPKVTELLVSMKRYMEKHFETIEKQLETLQSSHEELKVRLGAVETENAALLVKCDTLKETNMTLTNRVCGLEHELAELQQYTRNHNVEIRGIPLTKNEDIYVVLEAVAVALGIDFNRDSISAAHRLPKPRKQAFHPSIVVQFTSRTTRATWINASKQRKISTTDVATKLKPGPVYVVDHLTVRNKELLFRGKYHVKQGNLAFAWSREGRIFVRKTEDSAARRVMTLDEVDEVAGALGTIGGAGGGGGGNSAGDRVDRDGVRDTSGVSASS